MASLLFRSFTLFRSCGRLYLGCCYQHFHQASMNGSIFRDTENEDGGVARQHQTVGEGATGKVNRRDREEGRERELAEVVFPQGKHEHILARGLFRQIGDCCGGERKGSSPPPSPPPVLSLTPLTHQSHIAFAISTPHRGTPCHKHVGLAFGATTERDTRKSAALAERERERQRRTAIQTDEEQRRKCQRTRNTERGIGIVREMVQVREREKAKGGESAVGLKRSQGERRMIVSMITMERGKGR